ncbi:MAG: indole-3-glycerol phosphate synthase TrpC [Candidatus Omnitrophica bacterium]|nr:indole-3-glycerol phosphate synthase TrpC [Candidatus Omnitrophota bacterium]
MPSILKQILKRKKQEIELAKKKQPRDALLKYIKKQRYVRRDFKNCICKQGRICIIGELKKTSPSKGYLNKGLKLQQTAKIYARSGIDAISVLTDCAFAGRLEDIGTVRAAVKVPILRKDFIIDEYQLYQTRLLGADAVLLIAQILEKTVLAKLLKLAKKLGLDVLLEIHKKEDLKKIDFGLAEIIGINNRDLNNFDVDIHTTQRLIKKIPKSKIIVSESGINSREHLEHLHRLGVSAALIGEALITSGDVALKIKALAGKR